MSHIRLLIFCDSRQIGFFGPISTFWDADPWPGPYVAMQLQSRAAGGLPLAPTTVLCVTSTCYFFASCSIHVYCVSLKPRQMCTYSLMFLFIRVLYGVRESKAMGIQSRDSTGAARLTTFTYNSSFWIFIAGILLRLRQKTSLRSEKSSSITEQHIVMWTNIAAEYAVALALCSPPSYSDPFCFWSSPPLPVVFLGRLIWSVRMLLGQAVMTRWYPNSSAWTSESPGS